MNNSESSNTSNLTDNELVTAIFDTLEKREKQLKEKEGQLEERANKPLTLKEAVDRLEIEELHYLFFTMADIVKYLADHEAMYNDLSGQGCLQGAINIEDMAKQELIARMDREFTDERLEARDKTSEAEKLIDEIMAEFPDMAELYSERLENLKD